jgi:predicted lipoprotein with Yx(FWY)xxD motif
MRRAHSARMAGLGVLAALVLAACSSGSGGSAQQPAEQQQPPPQPAYTTTPPAQQPAQPGAGGFKIANSQYGAILTNAQGRTLYGFANDAQGKSTCYQQCAQAWPPVIAQSPPQGGQGLNPALLTAVPRQDGSMQVMYGKWPLYYFSGDQQAGQTNGQGSKGVWYVVAATGKLVKAAGGAATGGATQTTSAGGYGSSGGYGG